MGGAQSGTHNLGDALWIQERQRQRFHREGGRCDSNGEQTSSEDQRKLLKRTRSLAVISEDDSRGNREEQRYRPCDTQFDSYRRPQLIPRAKLIDRNSLKDRLSKSQHHLSESYDRFNNDEKAFHPRSGLYSLPPPLSSLPDPLPYARGAKVDPDRLNILDWPETPRRYHSVQDLETVSGLVDIVEDNWPIEENRSVDCIYTQVKRKRKEHRSLDSILFEDDDELEYFDILNLLPLSNVRLEYNESDAKNNNLVYNRNHQDFPRCDSKTNSISALSRRSERRSGDYRHRRSDRITTHRHQKGILTDEEKSSDHSDACLSDDIIDSASTKSPEINEVHEKRTCAKSRSSFNVEEKCQETHEEYRDENQSVHKERISPGVCTYLKKQELTSDDNSVTDVLPTKLKSIDPVDVAQEETEECKSIWISDNEEIEDMSRRPQVLKVVDNDVTRKNTRKTYTSDISSTEDDNVDNIMETKDNYQTLNKNNQPDLINDHIYSDANLEVIDVDDVETNTMKEETSVENARTYFEKKRDADKGTVKNRQNEGRFERIVKETSNILGKACNAVRGSLGFEARSESSDLGLGSETGSDSRRLSADDSTNTNSESKSIRPPIQTRHHEYETIDDLDDEEQKNHSNLTRSRSYVDSIESQDEPEFDHVRYKIVKSNVFSKNIFSCNSKKDSNYDGLMQYLREYSFQELLMDNNVVIIEPVRAESIDTKSSTLGKTKSPSNCRVSGTLDKKKKSTKEKNEGKGDHTPEHLKKSSRQSSLRKHFFYQPIRVNRELIDDELPDPDTVRNVRMMFEDTLKKKNTLSPDEIRNRKSRKSMSMRDLSMIVDRQFDNTQKAATLSRSRCSSRAKDLTRLFENMEKTRSSTSLLGSKDDPGSPRSESKTRIIAQSFEARSGQTSPSDSNSSKARVGRYHHRQLHNWDAGSVSSGVSSDYPDTDPGSVPPCTSSEDEELDCQYDECIDERDEGHYVSQDVLKKIRECGTSVTYYGGKVINTCNGSFISPMTNKSSQSDQDYVKFRLVKSNSCDSRLELTGRVVESRLRCPFNTDKRIMDLRQCTIDETPSIELSTLDQRGQNQCNDRLTSTEEKREPPVVIGLEPKKEENKTFKVEFKLGRLEDSKNVNRFSSSALSKWQVNNENTWKGNTDFGKMEFEEFEVLEDSLNGAESQS